MAPTIKVQQIILPNVVDDVNFIRVPKMDRCQTCHLAIDKKGYEKYPQPFTTHPESGPVSRRQLAASDRQGRLHRRATRAWGSRSASATPRTRRPNEKQKEEWEKKYHWEEPHLWDYPMLPKQDDRGVVREVPQAAGLHPEGRDS